jgi:hypothetical protein
MALRTRLDHRLLSWHLFWFVRAKGCIHCTGTHLVSEALLNQSGTIAFFLIVGFLVFVTIKGELPAYAKTVGLGS